MSERPISLSREEFYTLFEKAAPVISAHTVGFALVTQRGLEEDASLGGSGTLVSIDNRKGILTAEHVASNLLKHKGTCGLIVAKHGKSAIHRVLFTVTREQCTLFPNLDESESGPDLAFLQLDERTLDAIIGAKSFSNLTRLRERMLREPPKDELGAWYISGMPSEWTKEGQGSTPTRKVKEFRGMIGEIQLMGGAWEEDGFDYRIVDVQIGQEWPKDYEGYSGSGIWQVLIRERDGTPEIADRMLSGVAYYQTDPLEKGDQIIRQIYCNGRKSIYGTLVAAVRETPNERYVSPHTMT